MTDPLTDAEITAIERQLYQVQSTDYVAYRWKRTAEFIEEAPDHITRLLTTVEFFKARLAELDALLEEAGEES